MAIVWRARLSWRLPALLSRWRCWRPEETSSGATPACIASWASVRKRSMRRPRRPAWRRSARHSLGARAAAAPRAARASRSRARAGLLGGSARATAWERARDAHLHALLAAGQAPPEPLEHLQGAERAP